MVLDMFFKMLWQRFHKSQAGKDKVLIAKIRAGQKKSFDRHSTQVDLAGKALHQKVSQAKYGESGDADWCSGFVV